MKRFLVNRRRAFVIIGAACATAVMPVAQPRHEWHGTALGAQGRLIFHGLDGTTADRLVALAIAEIDRLEEVFSLYRPASQVSRLNRDAKLVHPSHDLQVVLAAALDVWRRSDGAFNPAIQPLWQMLAGHFAGTPGRPDPERGQISAALKLCNPAHIDQRDNAILLRPGMALTFNGIAQGYITDQVAALLHRHGLRNTLVQLGETRALPGRSWQVGVAGTGRRISLENSAIATSAGTGTRFSPDGRWHHLIDPLTGHSRLDYESVTVRAPSALIADALSTALAVAGTDNTARIARRYPQATIFAEHATGRVTDVGV